jgi:alpha-tubulin suppressor-like RCC1 family protein
MKFITGESELVVILGTLSLNQFWFHFKMKISDYFKKILDYKSNQLKVVHYIQSPSWVIFLISADGRLYSMGSNYQGQCGTR